MAIDAKQSFLGQVEQKCADILTVNDMGRVMSAISDLLENFDMRELRSDRWEMTEDDLMDAFISAMKIQGRSEKTIARYEYIISRFKKYIGQPTRRINVYHIRSWIAAEKQRGIQDSTLDGNRTVLSAYFGWLYREGLIDKNPVVNVGAIKVPKKQRKIYSDIDMEKLNKTCDNIRDRAIIHFLKSTGCRISEMTGLDRHAVDLERLECVVHGKGDKERTVYMSAVAGMLLRQYLEERTDGDPALFVGCRGERLQAGGVRTMLKKLGALAGVDNVHPHKFRRTLATGLARHGMPIQEVANVLGHENLDTTMRYVVLNKEDTRSDYRRYAS